MSELVLCADTYADNGEMILALTRIPRKAPYLTDDSFILDTTYGSGVWWKHWRPKRLVHPPGLNYFALPFAPNTFDAVTFDPPYVATGGKETSGVPEFNERYGLHDADAETPAELAVNIREGFDECLRVTRGRVRGTRTRQSYPGGLVIVKCMDYVSSGKQFLGTHDILTHALARGCRMEERLLMINAKPSMQPHSADNQVHARNNYSTMFVFRKMESEA